MGNDPVERLTEGQRECLRRVLRHMSSKEIARELGISSHTVDQRLRIAMHALGTTSRVEAAKLLVAREQGAAYQSSVYQPLYIAPTAEARRPSTATVGRVDLGIWQRLGSIMLVGIGSALAFGALLAGLQALAQLTQR